MSRRFTTSVVSALSIGAVAVAMLGAAAPAGAGPVAGSVQQVYHGGTATDPSVADDTYTGELLSVQTADIGTTAAEPTIGVDKDGVGYFAGSRNVVDTAAVWGVAATDMMRSDDNGLTWHSVGLRVPVTGPFLSVPPGNADPLMYLDPITNRVFDVSLMAACMWVNQTDDGGATWIPNPLACDGPPVDHQTFVTGQPRGAVVPTLDYPNIEYFCSNQLLLAECTRSTTGGLTWEQTGAPYPLSGPANTNDCGALTGHLVADPDGRIFLPKGACGTPWVAISDDSGDSWMQVEVSSMHNSVDHTAMASDDAGNLYYVFISPVGSSPVRQLPFLTVSTDHGTTWSEPVMVAPPGVTNANFPTVTAGEAGRIAINFPATLANSAGSPHTTWNQYMVVTVDALGANPLFLSATGNDPATNPIHRGACLGRCGGLWDFQDIQTSPKDGAAWAAAADDCTANCDTGTNRLDHTGRGLAIVQVGGPMLRG